MSERLLNRGIEQPIPPLDAISFIHKRFFFRFPGLKKFMCPINQRGFHYGDHVDVSSVFNLDTSPQVVSKQYPYLGHVFYPKIRDPVKKLILKNYTCVEDFIKSFTHDPLEEGMVPLFQGSWVRALGTSFKPLGINLFPTDFLRIPRGYWEDLRTREKVIHQAHHLFLEHFPEFILYLNPKTNMVYSDKKTIDEAKEYILKRFNGEGRRGGRDVGGLNKIFGNALTRKDTSQFYYGRIKSFTTDFLEAFGLPGVGESVEKPTTKRQYHGERSISWRALSEAEAIAKVIEIFEINHPEFSTLFKRNEANQIIEEKRGEAAEWIAERIGSQKQFMAVYPLSLFTDKRNSPFRSASYKAIMRKAFGSLGLSFNPNHFKKDFQIKNRALEDIISLAMLRLIRRIPDPKLLEEANKERLRHYFIHKLSRINVFDKVLGRAFHLAESTPDFKGDRRLFIIALAEQMGITIDIAEFPALGRGTYATHTPEQSNSLLQEHITAGHTTGSDISELLSDPHLRELYKNATDLYAKYPIALALITHKYVNAIYYLENFFPRGYRATPEELAKYEELEYQFIKHGEAVPKRRFSKTPAMERYIQYRIEGDEMLRSLRASLPAHVLAVVANERMFHSLTPDERVETLRTVAKALLNEHLGKIKVSHAKEKAIPLKEVVALIPDDVFRDSDKIVSHIIQDHFFNEALRLFIKGENEGFRQLDDLIMAEVSPAKKQFFREIRKEFEDVQKIMIPSIFRSTVKGWEGEPSPFPHFRQKYFIHKYMSRPDGRILINAATGSGKTASSFLAMETTPGVEKVTIFGPKKAAGTWPVEAQKIFLRDKKPDVFIAHTLSDLRSPRFTSAKYVFIGSEWMAHQATKHLSEFQEAVINTRGTDALILDEVDIFRHEDILSANMMSEIVTNLKRRTSRLPIVALTATPITSKMADLDLPLKILYPERFSEIPFSKACLADPRFAHNLLHGERLLMQWSQEDLFGKRAQTLDYETKTVKMSPFQKVLYEWILDQPMKVLQKTRLLQQVLLDPMLALPICRKLDTSEKKNSLQDMLNELQDDWKKWAENQEARLTKHPFGLDWVATYGDPSVALQLFLSGTLPYTESSSKYSEIRDLIRSTVRAKHDTPQKVFIVSPSHAEGIAWGKSEGASTLLDEVRKWTSDSAFVNEIYGQTKFKERRQIAEAWQSGKDNMVVIATLDSVNRAMDWAAREGQMHVLFLGWPWNWSDFIQMTGRFSRPGQKSHVRSVVLEGKDSIDEGFNNLTRYKRLLSELILHGIQLNPDEQLFFDSATVQGSVLLNESQNNKYFIQHLLRSVRGRGEEELLEYFSHTVGKQTYGQAIAEALYSEGQDEYTTAGNNASLVASILSEFVPESLLVLGAGTCLLARKLRQVGYGGNVINIDINPLVLNTVQEKFSHLNLGEMKVERASHLSFADSSQDTVDCSFMLPWTKVGKERVDIFTEMNRVLKLEGNAILTFPRGAFDLPTYARFCEAMKHFGFQIGPQSGISYATLNGKKKKNLGWIISLIKQGPVNEDSIDPASLLFLYDVDYVLDAGKRRKKARGIKEMDLPAEYDEFQIEDPKNNTVHIINAHKRKMITSLFAGNHKRFLYKAINRLRGTNKLNWEEGANLVAQLESKIRTEPDFIHAMEWSEELELRLDAEIEAYLIKK